MQENIYREIFWRLSAMLLFNLGCVTHLYAFIAAQQMRGSEQYAAKSRLRI